MAPLSDEVYRAVAKEHKTYLLEDLWEVLPRPRAPCSTSRCLETETTQGALERLKYEAAKKVLDGAELLVLSDRTAYEGERPFLDPHLALAAIDARAARVPRRTRTRRTCAGAPRSCCARARSATCTTSCMALGLGADGVCPYVMIEVICVDDYSTDISNICSALRKGIEKVISTIGIHEVRGYARLFSVDRPEAGAGRDLRHARLLRLGEAAARASPSSTPTPTSASASSPGRRTDKPAKTFRFYPKVYKAAIAAANGSARPSRSTR